MAWSICHGTPQIPKYIVTFTTTYTGLLTKYLCTTVPVHLLHAPGKIYLGTYPESGKD